MQHAVLSYETRLFIDGEFVPSKSGAVFPTVNPATEQVICNVSEAKEEDVDAAVDAAARAFAPAAPWRTMGGPARRDLIMKLAELIERDANALAYLESLDNGKPFSGANAGGYGSEVDMMLAVKHLRYYAGWADKMGGQVRSLSNTLFSPWLPLSNTHTHTHTHTHTPNPHTLLART